MIFTFSPIEINEAFMEVSVSNRLIMNFVLKPSLEHMALAKVVISLWNQNDVRALITKSSSSNLFSSKEWEAIEERVIQKVTQLSLPKLLKKNVLGLIKPVGLQIQGWLLFHFACSGSLLNLPAELCWTPQGTVDRKRTAKVLVRDDNLDMSTRYKLACIYCLEDDIHELWNSSTEDLKKSLLYTGCWYSDYWSLGMKRRGLDNVDIPYKNVFDESVLYHNKVAAEYFLQKLTPAEREESLVMAAKHARDADFLCFLLAEMKEEQQMQVFKNNPYGVLQCFLEWPFQHFFIGIANCMWDFLSEEHYDRLLGDITIKFIDRFKEYNYQKLFREFWRESPNALKSLITNEIDRSSLLQYLFDIKDKENIRLILKDATLTAKEKLIYSDAMNTLFESSINNNEWNFLEFCIRECFVSKNEMLKFKEEFEMRMSPCFKEHFAAKKHLWDQLFQFSDNSIFQYDKRSLEEGESSSPKRFHSLQ